MATNRVTNMKYFLAFVLALSSTVLWAATLVSDYQGYSADGIDYNLPNTYEMSADGGTTWTEIGAEVAGADPTMFRVFEPFDTTAQVEWLVRAKNTNWDRVSVAVPFAWGGEGTLPAPSGLRVIP